MIKKNKKAKSNLFDNIKEIVIAIILLYILWVIIKALVLTGG